jgi:hypothetical protein
MEPELEKAGMSASEESFYDLMVQIDMKLDKMIRILEKIGRVQPG